LLKTLKHVAAFDVETIVIFVKILFNIETSSIVILSYARGTLL